MELDLKNIRRELGITQEELARRLGVSLPTIYRWETGKVRPSKMGEEKLLILGLKK